ncbi:phosphoenolpyruvate carboxykinase (ATP) [Pseudocnuella soli]|uniref:phosphoenolpyruvate carboxykinase (ATP) n=1 Tax=Pseudocnuella soli TaxID=2502779 RepID=UPI001052C65E|nr:phosphoenolpyruvate carboxykinase (ATP) [Pseudocnuella soli]
MFQRLLASLNQQLWCQGIRKPLLHYQCDSGSLTRQTLDIGEGSLDQNGTLVINTGKFTGRSPKDKYVVQDDMSDEFVHWNDFHKPISPTCAEELQRKMMRYLSERQLWVRDSFACADPNYSLPLRLVSEKPWASLFAGNMFIAPKGPELETFQPEWYIFHAPGFLADPEVDGTNAPQFVVIDFAKKHILIGGTGYTGEIKKGMFTVLNYLLPMQQVLPMHCSANVGKKGDVALFFGLSGTGKTTLSADPDRRLVGDDEHGWSDEGIFNFEGGCYAKCIGLSAEKEPQIFAAIRPGALVENTSFFPGTQQINFDDSAVTENTRVSYPLSYIEGAVIPSVAGIPENIFFLTCDATGVLPPISRLTSEQAMYHFLAGYTAKVAGTETGITEPKSTFSACFGAPFLPLHPQVYGKMLKEKIRNNAVNVWLVNTGWTGGSYGTGSRIKLAYTRALIKAALDGVLEHMIFETEPVFGLRIPTSCPGVPASILNPRNAWEDGAAYDAAAQKLHAAFEQQMQKTKQAATTSRRGVFRTQLVRTA